MVSRISSRIEVDGTTRVGQADDTNIRTSWTDGTVTPSVTNNPFSDIMNIEDTTENDAGYSFTVDVIGGQSESLYVYVLGYGSTTMLTVTLGDETRQLFFDSEGGTTFGVEYLIDFTSPIDDTMTVKFGFDPNQSQTWPWSSVGIKAAALVPEPASLGLLAMGSLLILGRRRKRVTA